MACARAWAALGASESVGRSVSSGIGGSALSHCRPLLSGGLYIFSERSLSRWLVVGLAPSPGQPGLPTARRPCQGVEGGWLPQGGGRPERAPRVAAARWKGAVAACPRPPCACVDVLPQMPASVSRPHLLALACSPTPPWAKGGGGTARRPSAVVSVGCVTCPVTAPPVSPGLPRARCSCHPDQVGP